MNICVNCFQDRYLKKYILENGSKGDCNYCDSKNIQSIDVSDLSELFSPLIETYDAEENFLPSSELGSINGKFLSEILQDDWQIFESDDYMLNKQILEDMFATGRPGDISTYMLDSYWQDKDKYWGIVDEVSEETRNKWEEFKNELKFKNRFFLPSKYNFKDIEKTLKYLTISFDKGRKFNRARKSPGNEVLDIKDMARPEPEKTPAGRANPVGIPYLYLSNKPETCIAEIRPLKYEYITLATFELLKSAKLIDLRSPLIKSPFIFGEEIKYLKFDAPLLRIFNKTLSEPIDHKLSQLEYLPSQFLCELIKNIGYEGIVFDSSQIKKGYNIVFFDDVKLVCKERQLIQIDEAMYSYVKIKQ